ncbi:DNA polymerase beta [Eumeta japonica]|uniref:DNA polymerase n=1 Tax=Eumeta variegata TaxID=151549 RepID=A0A4C1W0N9_EUMVA|nr:DNA polymerase beta [Eumeta japonica]
MSERKNPADKGNANGDICTLLIELADYERNVARNIHKYNAYRKAAAALAAHPQRVRSGDEARRLPGVGVKIANKIQEFLTTGKLRKLETIRGDDNARAVATLTRVSGVGPARAAELVRAGITTIEMLRQNQNRLTHHQCIGLRYLEDFEQRIPRTEIQQIEKVLQKVICGLDPDYSITICGSYRRGKSESGDIDALVTHPSLEIADKSMLKNVGVCRLEGRRARRIDVRLMRPAHYPCALLYFTGSDAFNQAMRAHATQHRFILNEYTLRPIGETGTPGEPVPVTNERDIFEYIDYPYREPHERNM